MYFPDTKILYQFITFFQSVLFPLSLHFPWMLLFQLEQLVCPTDHLGPCASAAAGALCSVKCTHGQNILCEQLCTALQDEARFSEACTRRPVFGTFQLKLSIRWKFMDSLGERAGGLVWYDRPGGQCPLDIDHWSVTGGQIDFFRFKWL